jgi:hypothetical protein
MNLYYFLFSIFFFARWSVIRRILFLVAIFIIEQIRNGSKSFQQQHYTTTTTTAPTMQMEVEVVRYDDSANKGRGGVAGEGNI